LRERKEIEAQAPKLNALAFASRVQRQQLLQSSLAKIVRDTAGTNRAYFDKRSEESKYGYSESTTAADMVCISPQLIYHRHRQKEKLL